MGYSSGLLKDIITILNRQDTAQSDFGRNGDGFTWEESAEMYASVEWQKGKSAMNAGALDAYGVVLIRMRWNDIVTMRSRVRHNGKLYQILPETFHDDYHANTIQFLAQLIINES